MSTRFRAFVRIAMIAGVVTLGGSRAWAQGPTINTPSLGSPGGGGSLLGTAPGSGGAPAASPTSSLLGGRAGAGSAKGIQSSISSSAAIVMRSSFSQQGIAPTANNPSAKIPASGPLSLPPTEEDPGPEYGLTLDQAIERLIQENLDLKSKFYEIPQAKADILTASLRANPVFYADGQLVPYGQYTRTRPGGQTQYDVNISYPLDLSRKRQARTASAVRATKTIEAQYQDAVRQTIDNLYSAYVDVLQARRTIAFSKASLEGLKGALTATEDLFKRGEKKESDVRRIRIQVNQAETQLKDGMAAYSKAKQALATQINVPTEVADRIELRGTLKYADVTLPSIEEMMQIAMTNRPDVVAYRLGVERAKSDVKLQYANRFQDVYVLAQPYTFQDNTPFGLKSPTSWALGVTIPMPLYDRNQGNIQRSKMNVTQTEIELSSTERQALQDVRQAELEFVAAKTSVERIETTVLPDSTFILNEAKRLFPSEIAITDYLAALQEYNDGARAYLDAQVRFRRAMLDMNTAVGQRILP
jgi:cobalt-zinc-cadmium efflux system outer membrane protein